MILSCKGVLSKISSLSTDLCFLIFAIMRTINFEESKLFTFIEDLEKKYPAYTQKHIASDPCVAL
jgi:hypothetical protein